jgi:hypothetical protein
VTIGSVSDMSRGFCQQIHCSGRLTSNHEVMDRDGRTAGAAVQKSGSSKYSDDEFLVHSWCTLTCK